MSGSYLRAMNAPSDTEVDYAVNSSSKWSENEETAVDDGTTSLKHRTNATTAAAPQAASSKLGAHSSDDWNYVRRTLAKEKPLPPITWKNVHKNINWISFFVLTLVPAIALYGAATQPLRWQTAVWCVLYYFYTGLGITAGYHRLWAHRAYNAKPALQYFLALGGSGAVEGSIRWWCRGHRSHHRYTDTDLDPYSAHKGFWWSHIGWMIFKGRRKPGVADVSDLSANPVIRWQHRFYLPLIFGMGFVFPTLIAGLGWGDWWGGFFYAGAARLLFVHHSTFCVNSLAHWLGEGPFDDKHTPRDHFVTALVTVGEGYHNFHHQFPADYRNAIRWYQYDPTKWFIWVCYKMGLAYNLKVFPENEIQKGMYAMELKKVESKAAKLAWPSRTDDLPVYDWDQFQELCKTSGRALIVIAGFIHDVTTFMDEHPGGRGLIQYKIGKDATPAFFGGVYDHSRAAHNWLTMLRVGALAGGYELAAGKIDVEHDSRYAADGSLFRSEAIKTLSTKEKSAIKQLQSTLPKRLDVARN